MAQIIQAGQKRKRSAEFVAKRAELEQAWRARMTQREELAEAQRDHDRKVGTPKHPDAVARLTAAQAAWDKSAEKDRHEAAHSAFIAHISANQKS